MTKPVPHRAILVMVVLDTQEDLKNKTYQRADETYRKVKAQWDGPVLIAIHAASAVMPFYGGYRGDGFLDVDSQGRVSNGITGNVPVTKRASKAEDISWDLTGRGMDSVRYTYPQHATHE